MLCRLCKQVTHRLLTLSIRNISDTHRKIIRCPVKGGLPLITSPVELFKQRVSQSAANRGFQANRGINLLRAQYKKLSKHERQKYIQSALKNVKRIVERRNIFREANLDGRLHFIKTSLVKKWHALGPIKQLKYIAQAERIRKSAIVSRDRIVAQYGRTVPK